jgi:small multidrug resistance family-3 protein
MAFVYFSAAALLEIAGCFSVWAWTRQHRSALWVVPGMVCLAVFAYTLTRVESPFAGRAYAAYGGVYIVASLLWLCVVERTAPDRYDLLGAAVCLIGASVILLGPRAA